MSDVTGVGGQSVIDQFSIDNNDRANKKENDLGRNEFLKLFIAQLNNQDPLSPQDNGEFVAQLAQFSSLEGIENLNDTNEGIAENIGSTQALQASSLVGRSVIVPGNESSFLRPQGVISGYAELPQSSSDVRLTIKDENGSTLETISLGQMAAGPMTVRWDGASLEVNGEIFEFDRSQLNRQEYYKDENGDWVLDADGNRIPIPYESGDYKFSLSFANNGQSEQLETMMSSQVQSVSLGAGNQVTLNLYGGNKADISAVKQILDA